MGDAGAPFLTRITAGTGIGFHFSPLRWDASVTWPQTLAAPWAAE